MPSKRPTGRGWEQPRLDGRDGAAWCGAMSDEWQVVETIAHATEPREVRIEYRDTDRLWRFVELTEQVEDYVGRYWALTHFSGLYDDRTSATRDATAHLER